VAPPDSVAALAESCDDVVCPLQPHRFEAVGSWYDDFTQTTDSEVISLLASHDHGDAQGGRG
jgi:putative phosphoribosyl transferase